MKSPLLEIIIKIAATVLVIGSVFYFIVSPKLAQLAENQIEIERLGSEMKQADTKLAALKAQDKNRAQLDSYKKEVTDLLPDDPSASSFILNMESTSSTEGIIINSLSITEVKAVKKTADATDKTTTPTASAGTKKTATEKALNFSTSFTSDYSKSQAFLKSLELLPRFNSIENISISNYQPQENTMSIQASGKIYYGK